MFGVIGKIVKIGVAAYAAGAAYEWGAQTGKIMPVEKWRERSAQLQENLGRAFTGINVKNILDEMERRTARD